MAGAWPAITTAVALGLLLYLIIRVKFEAFAALLVVSIGAGLASGMPPESVLESVGKGIGDILKDVAAVLALGAMLGRMLEASGGAQVIARTLVGAFGVERASGAILLAAYLVGIPVLFNVGFLLLVPIMWRLQRDTGRSLLWFVLPLAFSLSTTHSLVPPHPGILGAARTLGADMVQTIVFGALLGIPMVLAGWLGPGRWWASRELVTAPDDLSGKIAPEADAREGPAGAWIPPAAPPSFALSLGIVVLPLALCVLGFGTSLLGDSGLLPAFLMEPPAASEGLPRWLGILAHPPVAWLRFLGEPVVALLVATGLAFLLLGRRRGMGRDQLGRIAAAGIQDIGAMALLFGGAGAFKQIIIDSGTGEYVAGLVGMLPLSPVAAAFGMGILLRIALGSATAAILTASALLAGLARSMPDRATLLVLALACGVTSLTQPGDSGFWLVKEYSNLSVKQVLVRFNACRVTIGLTGLIILLGYEAWLAPP
jgi:gluconate transporter